MAKNIKTEKEENKYQILLNNSPDFVFESRIDNFKFTKVNQRACDFYGYTNDEFLKMSIFDIEVEPPLKEQIRELYDATPVGKVIEVNGTNKKKDGSEFHVHVRFAKLNNEFALANVRDITERMKTEVALKESEEHYRSLVEQSSDAIYVIQGEHYVLVNKAWENLFGYSRAEAYSPGFDYWNIIAPKSHPLTKERRIIRTAGKLIKPRYEFFGLTQDNRTLHIETIVVDILWKGQPAIQGIYRDITERKNAEVVLRESEEKYRSLFENSQDAICITSFEGKFLNVNQATLDLFEYSYKEMLALPVKDLYNNPDDRRNYQKIMMNAGSIKNYQVKLRKKDGSVLDCLYTSTVQKVGDKITGYQTIIRDITERKRADEALRESEQRFRDLYNNAPAAYLAVGRDGRIQRANQQTAKLLGYALDDVIGRPVFDLYADTPDGKEKARQVFQRFVAGERTRDEELQMRHADGRLIWIALTVEPVRDADGEILETRSIVIDITARKQAEDRLKESEKKSRAWLENSPVCTKIINKNLNLQFMSSAGITGLKIDDITAFYGKPYPFYFFPDSTKILMTNNLKKVKETGNIIEQEALVFDLEGNEIWYHSTLIPVNDANGQLDYIMVISTETTERKQAEAALRESENSLTEAQRIAKMGSWIWDLKTNDITWSDNLCLMHGMNPEEFDGQFDTVMSLIHPDDLESVQKEIHQMLDEKQSMEFEYRIVARNGVEKVVRGDQRLTFDSEGNILRLVGILQDITERKNAEEMLQLRGQIVENMEEGVCLFRTEDGAIVYSNPRFDQLFGYNTGELIGKDASLLNFQNDLTSVEQGNKIGHGMAESSRWSGEIKNVKKDGSGFWCHVNYSMLEYKDFGSVWIGVYEDITDRKEAEASLQQKEMLLKEIHHRIKNNLQVISSLLDLKLGSAAKKSTVELLKESQNQIRSISLVHEYLYQSRDLEHIDFGNYVQSLIEQLIYSYGLKSKNLNIKINIDEFLKVDQAIHCGLIINEMVSNSLKHAFKGIAKPKIRIELHSKKSDLLTLIVGDNGLGITQSLDFRRTKTLGFQLIQALVKQLHGTIQMRRNGGTEFRIKFEREFHQISTLINER